MKNIILIALVLILGSMVYFALSKTNQNNLEQIIGTKIESNGITMTLHKSPYCGCCGSYGEYMEDLGYEVIVKETEDMDKVKNDFGVPYELGSCHTTRIDGYVVEGHVPEEAIKKLLMEKPNIKGIGMSGMPSGSPGMPGTKEDFMVYEINNDGTKGNLFLKL